MPDTIEVSIARIDERLRVLEETLLPMLQKTLDRYFETVAGHEHRLNNMERDLQKNSPGRILYTDGPWFQRMEALSTEWTEFKARSLAWRWIERLLVPVAVSLLTAGALTMMKGR